MNESVFSVICEWVVQNWSQEVYAFTGNLAPAFLLWKVAWNCIFPTSVFPVRDVFPATSRKRIEHLSPPESEPIFSVVNSQLLKRESAIKNRVAIAAGKFF